jgi:hypothetical protein
MANASVEISKTLHGTTDYPTNTIGSVFGDAKTVGSNLRKILGSEISLSRAMNMGAMTLYEGPGQSTYGIPFAIDGTATVVEDRISLLMAGFEDPIKAVFATSVHPSQKIIFKRKYVKGGQALVVPERAPARTVSVAFDQREERMTRHAMALEQNLNLYLREDDAREDLDMKLEAITMQMQQAWVSMTYQKAFSQGTNIVEALQRGDALAAIQSPDERILEADRMYVEMFCGTVNKSEFPFKNLAASIAKASIYTPTGSARETPAVMLVPPGMVDLYKYTRKSEMMYSVTGLRTNDGRNTIDLPLKNVMDYPDANLKVMVHTPPAFFREGASHAQVDSNEMQTSVAFATYYIETMPGEDLPGDPYVVNANANLVRLTDFKTQEWKTLPPISNKDTKDLYTWYLRPQMVTNNNSAILSTRPGAATGEMVYSYPSVYASQSNHTQSFVLTLTVYFGAAVRNPERLLILNGIQFSGIVGGHGSNVNIKPVTRVVDGEEKTFDERVPFNEEKHDLVQFATNYAPWETEKLFKYDELFINQCKEYKLYPDEFFNGKGGEISTDDSKLQRPIAFYRGTTAYNNGTIRKTNIGHLGLLDHPENVAAIKGYQVCKTFSH